jgi:hypothetical protein
LVFGFFQRAVGKRRLHGKAVSRAVSKHLNIIFPKIPHTMNSIKNIFLRTFVVLFILSALLLSGCINVQINHTITEDGTGEIEMIYDMSQIMGMVAGMAQSGGQEAPSEETTCAQMTNGSKLDNLECRMTSQGVFVLKGTIDMVENGYLTIEEKDGKKVYSFSLDNIEPMLASNAENADSVVPSDDDESIAQAKQMGANYTYTLTMPGKIVQAEIGSVEGNTLTIDMLEEAGNIKGKTIISEAEGSGFANMLIIIIGAVLLLIVVIVIVVVALGMKKKPKPDADQPASPASGEGQEQNQPQPQQEQAAALQQQKEQPDQPEQPAQQPGPNSQPQEPKQQAAKQPAPAEGPAQPAQQPQPDQEIRQPPVQ